MYQSSRFFRKYQQKPNGPYNVVAMDGSKKMHFADLNVLYSLLAKHVENGNLNLSLVPYSATSKMRLFFDVDRVGTLNICQILKIIDEFVVTLFGSVAKEKYYLKNQKYNKWHVYYHQVIVKKTEVKRMNTFLNREFVKLQQQMMILDADQISTAVIDQSLAKPKGPVLRCEGFNKFNAEIKDYEANTMYKIVHPANTQIDLAFYQDVNLLINEEDALTAYESELSVVTSATNQSVANHVDLLNQPQSEAFAQPPVMLSNEEAEVNEEKNDDDDAFETQYPDLKWLLSKYPVRKNGMSLSDDGSFIILDFDKSEAGKFCELSRSSHQNNNSYLMYFINDRRAVKKCRKMECRHASFTVANFAAFVDC